MIGEALTSNNNNSRSAQGGGTVMVGGEIVAGAGFVAGAGAGGSSNVTRTAGAMNPGVSSQWSLEFPEIDLRSLTAAAAALVAAHSALRGNVFYAVDEDRFDRMREITPAQALMRAVTGKNVYTEHRETALLLATVAGGRSPAKEQNSNPLVGRILDHSEYSFNAHYHVYWQHFDTDANHIFQKGMPNAHIYFGTIIFQQEVIRP